MNLFLCAFYCRFLSARHSQTRLIICSVHSASQETITSLKYLFIHCHFLLFRIPLCGQKFINFLSVLGHHVLRQHPFPRKPSAESECQFDARIRQRQLSCTGNHRTGVCSSPIDDTPIASFLSFSFLLFLFLLLVLLIV